MIRRALRSLLPPAMLALALLPAACRRAPAGPPNVLFVVWDTVRADHLSLYGHPLPTTPHLDAFAKRARVFDDCITVGSTTVPAHASMFTGLLPSEHGLSNQAPRMDESFVTLAETLKGAGYRTYLFSENPQLQEATRLTQGFDVAEYPWSPAYAAEALAIVRAKIDPEDRSTELPERLASGRLALANLKDSGPLPQRALLRWLDRERGRPFFVLLNFMEAHQPLIPSRAARAKLMTPAQVTASYRVDRRWNAVWDYTLGLRDYTPEQLELTRLTYDAALLELDERLHALLEALRERGELENTVVVLVGDHGEQLGEKHMLDHQYSVGEPLMRVPLVLWYPPRVPAGREAAPVTNMDLYPTLLELAGVPVPTTSTAVSLLRPVPGRPRLGAYPTFMTAVLAEAVKRVPGFDPKPFERTLQALYRDRWKLVVGSDGSRRLYDLSSDPHEERDLAAERPDLAAALGGDLSSLLAATRPPPRAPATLDLDPETRARLEALGYVSGAGKDEGTAGAPAVPPSPRP